MGKLEVSVDKYLLKEKSSAEMGFSLWRKLFLPISLFGKLKKAPHLTGGLLKYFLNYLSETTLIGTFATT